MGISLLVKAQFRLRSSLIYVSNLYTNKVKIRLKLGIKVMHTTIQVLRSKITHILLPLSRVVKMVIWVGFGSSRVSDHD